MLLRRCICVFVEHKKNTWLRWVFILAAVRMHPSTLPTGRRRRSTKKKTNERNCAEMWIGGTCVSIYLPSSSKPSERIVRVKCVLRNHFAILSSFLTLLMCFEKKYCWKRTHSSVGAKLDSTGRIHSRNTRPIPNSSHESETRRTV